MGDSVKVWYKSKGMWAGVLTTICGAYSLVQVNFPQLHLFNLVQVAPILFTILGILGVYGRVSADGKIVFSDQKSN